MLTLASENVIVNLQKCKKEVIEMATNIPELKAECTRHGVTLEELASRIGVNNATLYRKMTGKSEAIHSIINPLIFIRRKRTCVYPISCDHILTSFLCFYYSTAARWWKRMQ